MVLHTKFAVQPINPPSLNGLESGSIFRPRRQLIAIGMPYETPRATTEAEIIALKALFGLAARRSVARRIDIPARSQENTAKDDDKDDSKVQSIEGKLKLRMDFSEDARERNTSISCKSISHATRCCHD